jgi:flagellar hook-length control protein FliK
MIDVMLGPPGVAAGKAKPEIRDTRDAFTHDFGADFSHRLKDASSPSTRDRPTRTAHDKTNAAGPAQGELHKKEPAADVDGLDETDATPAVTSSEVVVSDDAAPAAVDAAPAPAEPTDTVVVAAQVPTPLADEVVLPGVVPVSTSAQAQAATKTPEVIVPGVPSALTATDADATAQTAPAAAPALELPVAQAAGESGKDPAPPAATVTLTIATVASASDDSATAAPANPVPGSREKAATKVPQAPSASPTGVGAPTTPAMDGEGVGASGQTSAATMPTATGAPASAAAAPAPAPAAAVPADTVSSTGSFTAPSFAPITTRDATRAAGVSSPHTLSTPRQVAEDLGMRMQMSLREGGREVMLSFRPADLGHVVVKVSMVDGVLRAQVTADRPEAVRMLEQALPHLTDALSERGLSLQGMDISYHRPTDDRPEPSFTGRSGRSRGGDSAREGDGPLAEVISVGPMSVAARLGKLDLLA